MKRNNVNRVLLNDFLGADYADYTDSFSKDFTFKLCTMTKVQ